MNCYQKVFSGFQLLLLFWCTVAVAPLREASKVKALQKHVMSSDASNVVGVEENGDVKLIGTGWINVTLDYPPYQLEIGVCKHECRKKSIVCYPNSASSARKDLFCPDLPSYCGFKVEIAGTSFSFWETTDERVGLRFFASCHNFTMKAPTVDAVTGLTFPSCDPKSDEKHMIQLYAEVDPSCPLWLRKAKIHFPPPPPTVTSLTAAEDSSASAGFASKYWYIFLIIGIVLIAIVMGIIIGCVVYKKTNLFKSRRSKLAKIPHPEPVVTEPPPPTSEPQVAADNSNLPKKQDEPAKQDEEQPKTAEEAQPPPPSVEPAAPLAPSVEPVAPPPPPPAKPLQLKEAAAVVPASKRPKKDFFKTPGKSFGSVKSKKADSLEIPMRIMQQAANESPADSIKRNYPIQPELVETMKQNYPIIPGRAYYENDEVDLLNVPISRMCAKMKVLSLDGEQKLTAMGAVFDNDRRIVSMPNEARQYLNDRRTPACFSSFAFGAEYHTFIFDDYRDYSKLSIPLLMCIALQLRFPEQNRRRAMTSIRRRIPDIRAAHTVDERQKMAYPINLIEMAYLKNPKYFDDWHAIETDSEGERQKKIAEAAKKPPPKHVKKSKRKSSKKHRH